MDEPSELTATLMKWKGTIFGIPWVGKTDELSSGWRQHAVEY